MNSSIVKISKLKKIYDEIGIAPKVALEHIDLEIIKGEFICIMGPSGSGKTTLLNIISTIDKATSGQVEILGENLIDMGNAKRADIRKEKIGFIFQEFNLLYSLTMKENILFPLMVNDIDVSSKREEFNKIVKLLGIDDILDKYVYECSGGQQQRVAIARALIKEPEIMIADEPTGNLDSQNARDLMEILIQINKEFNTTVIMVTHDIFVASYSSRLLYIKDGKIFTELKRENMSKLEYFDMISHINSQNLKS